MHSHAGAWERGKKQLLKLETAIHKMTGLSAATFGLKDRGLIKPGYFADLVLLDPQTIIDRGTFDDPKQPADGINSVWVNGKLTWDSGGSTHERGGRFLH